jgi:hypothetical protein
MTPELKAALDYVKNLAEDLYSRFSLFSDPTNGREIALAKTKLEESIMWAVKGMTK